MKYENMDAVRRIDFDRLDMLVSERLATFKLYAQNMDRIADGPAVHDAVCRDLILPCIGLLASFIDCVNVEEVEK